jgi:hypothetical protein
MEVEVEAQKLNGSIEMLLLMGGSARTAESPQLVLDVRATGIIAKPERIGELTACIEGPVTNLLREESGFVCAIVLQSHKEGRSVLVLTFWDTKAHATNCCWEESTGVQGLISPLIDVCAKAQTFQANVPYVVPRTEDRGACGVH